MFSFFKRRSSAPAAQPDNREETRAFVQQTVGFLLDKKEGLALDDVRISKTGQAIIALNGATGQLSPDLEAAIKAEVSKITGISSVLIVLTEHREGGQAEPQPAAPEARKIPDVKHIIAVSSGKGGVGKSTVAINLALALSRAGKKTGILDADIYGPSLPRLSGLSGQRAGQGDDGRIVPLEAFGVKMMSMGFLVDEAAPMIWRGPMLQSALMQMMRDVVWDGLDVLVIDLPPGTGDVHLTLAQKYKLAGGVVVSTPQDIALIDARKGLEMFRKLSVPVLGIVENMSYFCCPSCGHTEHIFGHGGARREAEKLGVPFLGEIPLHTSIRETSDSGNPVVVSAPESAEARGFARIADLISVSLP